MKLCEYCVTNVLESKVSWDYHSHSYRALEVESKFQCLFCSTLREDIKRVAPWLKESDYTGTWPIYRWSIRSLVKIRESPETVVVTFRYVPPEKGPDGDSSKKDDIELQKRTFFLFPENDLQPLPNAEYLGNTTNPADNGGHQIRSWVVNCDRTHTDCMRRKKAMPKARSFVPTRLLDISGKPGAHIKVVETAKTSVQGPYCSLSHSWGPKPNFVRLLRNNINLFTTEGVPWSLFTKNFKEAVEIARTLDIGYIWIDSLCIIQMDAQDWEHEASRMHLVYRNSYCNIALADAIDQYGGAFRGREPESVLPVQYKSKKDSPMFHGKKWRIVPEDLWTRELLHSRLYTRGWVFQERMLSPRILHFAKNQIFWDCPSLSACEALPAGLPRPMDSTAAPDRHWRGRLQESEGSQDIAGSNDQPLSTFWQTAVRNYTSCELTKRKDKLIALWGIAKLIKDVMGVEYGEGLWEDHLEDQLTWRVAECKHEERPVTEDRHIPSWSWASMDGEIIIADRLSDKEHRTICDHNGHDLELDLKGVKRYARSSLLPRRPSGPGPMLKQRVQSDSVLEVKHSTTKAHNDQSAHYDGTHPQTSSNAAKVDEDAEPTLHHSSIAIQGHINSGILELDQAKNSWILRLNGKETFDMDAYPDTVPDRTRLEHTTKFVVLSTKKVVKSRKEWIPAGSSGDIELEGRGILLEPVIDKAKDHFRRVGAFEFRGASAQTFDRLLVTDGWEGLSSNEFDPKLGRKFWLV